MSDEDRASTDGMPEAGSKDKTLAAPAQVEEAEVETTFVVPEGLPFQCTAVHLPQEDGSTLVIDREGTHVPSADLEALQEQARASGVVLNTEVSD